MSFKNAHWITWFIKCHITIVLVNINLNFQMPLLNHIILFLSLEFASINVYLMMVVPKNFKE
jgi:hypothetical protein